MNCCEEVAERLAHSPAAVGRCVAADLIPPSFDARLQASRRLDWRFLLPDPNLGFVLYLGPVGGVLYESLQMFSASLTAARTLPARGGAPRRFQVIVAVDPGYDVLHGAAQWLVPGGSLYVEGRRHLGAGQGGLWRCGPTRAQPQLRHAGDYIAALRGLGFARCEGYWHWPDFENCREIVPLYDAAALRHAFARRRSGAVARLKAAVGQKLLCRDWLATLVPCFSVVACKSEVKPR